VALFDYQFEPVDITIFLTLVVLEGILSFDNAAILAAMVRRLPPEQRRKALLYGLVGAYVFRLAAIGFVVVIIQNPFLRVIGGGYLVFLGIKHFYAMHRHARGKPHRPWQIPGLSAFWATVVSIELADIAFALDQVVAAVAFTDKVVLIVAAAFAAILALRLSAVYMSRLMDWFPALEHIAYVVVGLVGIKLVLEEYPGVHLDKAITAPLTLAIFVVPVVVKIVRDRMGKRRPFRA
jgi:YkoY family integral membrane protein